MKTLINAIRTVILQIWLIVSHLVIYAIQAAKHCLWVGALGWIVLVYGISGAFQFSWGDLKIVAVVVLVLSVFMALIRMIEVIILIVRGHKLTAAGKHKEAKDLDLELNKNLFNIPGFTFHFAPEEKVITK